MTTDSTYRAIAESADSDGRITQPYLNVINIPLYRDTEGSWWGDPLWIKDLLLHLPGITDFRLLCPLATEREEGWVRIARDSIKVFTVRPLGRDWILHLPELYRQIDCAVADAAIVHTGVGGWPFPLGWLATIASLRRKRFLMIVVESAFWRIPPGTGASIGSRLRSNLFERLAKFCAARADLLVGTQPAYLKLAGPDSSNTFLNPASWIDDENVLGIADAQQIWETKGQCLLYAGRLTAEKGVLVLIEALRELGSAAPRVDFIGEGSLLPACLALASDMPDRVRILKPVSYGQPFFELLDRYRGVIVPICSDEQPRIIFDAYARAVPVLGSNAVGVSSCVTEGKTGWLHSSGSSTSLMEVLKRTIADPTTLQSMGLNALALASRSTHREMHSARIARVLQAVTERNEKRAIA